MNLLISRCILLIVCINLHIFSSYGRTGVDFSFYLQQNQISEVLAADLSNSFAVIQTMFYNSSINYPGIQSIKSAALAGVKDISTYIYPCVPRSAYSISYKRNDTADYCQSPSDQIDNLLTSLALNNIHFRNSSYDYLDKHYVYSTAVPHSAMGGNNTIYLQTLYINVEDQNPSYYFSQNSTTNIIFMKELVDYAMSKKIEVGFYTTKQDWLNIMTRLVTHLHSNNHTNDFIYDYPLPVHKQNQITLTSLINPFHKLKLWTPRFDSLESMSFYSAFGDWDEPYMKQLKGGTTDLRRIGSARVCLDYVE